MINNRQNGRRRGRGGNQRPGGGGQGQRDNGNRIDSRARGNAPQLLEKYKNMARDAQMAGDRVNTEYYLQFADHYFRVLADQRGRSDDQHQHRRVRDDFDQFDDVDDFGDEGEVVRVEEQVRATEADAAVRRDRAPREDARRDDVRRDEGRRSGRAEQRGERAEVQEAPVAPPLAAAPVVNDVADDAPAVEEAPRRRRGRKPREEIGADGAAPASQAAESHEAANLEEDRLPPALGVAVADEGSSADAAPKPRRRRVRASAEATTAG